MTYQALQVTTPTTSTGLTFETDSRVSMDDAAEAERYWEQHGAELTRAYGLGDVGNSDDTDALADFGLQQPG